MSYRSIAARQGVTLSLHHRLSRPAVLSDHAVGNKPATVAEQYDITVEDVGLAGTLDDQRVARPNGGQHTPARDLQSQSSRRTQHLARQITFEGVRFVRYLWRRCHDALGRATHELCVVPIFPQDKAVVTNTCSKRNDGFSYGFLINGVRGLSEDISFIVIGGPNLYLSIVMPIVTPARRSRRCRQKWCKFGCLASSNRLATRQPRCQSEPCYP